MFSLKPSIARFNSIPAAQTALFFEAQSGSILLVDTKLLMAHKQASEAMASASLHFFGIDSRSWMPPLPATKILLFPWYHTAVINVNTVSAQYRLPNCQNHLHLSERSSFLHGNPPQPINRPMQCNSLCHSPPPQFLAFGGSPTKLIKIVLVYSIV